MRATTAAIAIASAFAFSATAQAQVQLKIANYFPPPSQQSKTTEAFGQELEKRSGDGHRRPAELRGPDDQRVLEQAAPLEVEEKPRRGTVEDLGLVPVVGDDV